MTKITCVMPAYNEENLIITTVTQTLKFWDKTRDSFHLVVVDDGSSDRTAAKLNSLSKKYKNLTVITQPTNLGKGAALKTGIAACPDSDVIYIIDADLPYSLSDQQMVANQVADGCQTAYGSRASSTSQRGNTLLRAAASSLLTYLNKRVLHITIIDTQCGLKAFEGQLAKKLFSLVDINGWGFDLMTTSILERSNIEICTVSVKLLPETRKSRVKLVSSGLAIIKDMIHINRVVTSDMLVDTRS